MTVYGFIQSLNALLTIVITQIHRSVQQIHTTQQQTSHLGDLI